MRTLTNRHRTATPNSQLIFVTTSSLLALALLLGSWASTSQAYGPTLQVINLQGQDLGYYDMYSFSGQVLNSQNPTSLTVTIYFNGNPVGTCTPNSVGNFQLTLMCPGGEVVAETFESPASASDKIVIP